MKIKYFFFWLLLTATLSACVKSALEQEEILYKGPMMTSTDVRTLYSENAILKFKLEAPLQVVEQSGDVRYPKGVKVTSYNRDGLIESTLLADSGKYEKTSSVYTAYGNVVVQNVPKEQQLKTDFLVWHQNKKEVSTDKPVYITTPSEVIYGIGLTTDESFSNYKIWKMSAVFDLDAQSPKRPDTLRNIEGESAPVIGDKRKPLNRNEVKPSTDPQTDPEKLKFLQVLKKKTSILNGKGNQ
jgi:LPS export ABC transporter protein LptC